MTSLVRQLRVPRKRRTVNRDEFGGSQDGGLAIITGNDRTIHVTPPRVATALRYLLARAQSGGQDVPARLALTAAMRGEGVTYVTRSLASVIAYDTESSVALVDLNWRLPPNPDKKPAKHADDEAPVPTLADAVDGLAKVDEILQPTTNPRLSLVTAGVLPLARRPGVAGGRALETLVGEIAERFDHVLLDLPPVLASSDAIQLVKLSDAYALVVLQGVTPESQIEAAMRELGGIDSLGVVLNRFDSKVPKFLRRMVEE